MTRIIAILLLATTLVACMGDGTMWVSGQLHSAQANPLVGCKIKLLLPSDRRIISERAIDAAEFAEDFVVAPRDKSYPVVVSCAGHVPFEASARYGAGGGNKNSLGVVTLHAHGT